MMNTCASMRSEIGKSTCGGPRDSMLPTLLLLFVLIATGGPLYAQGVIETRSLVVPSELVNSYGSSGVAPFVTTAVEFAYGASTFRDAATDQILLTGVSFRINESSTGSTEVVLPVFTVYAGVYQGELAPFTGFLPLVRSAVVFQGRDVRFDTTPAGFAFNFTIPFSQPFAYDRHEGHLVIGMGGWGPNIGLDAEPSSNGLYQYRTIFSTVESLPMLVAAEFSYLPIPEPATLVILLIGGVLLLMGRRRA
jgi:hypothetical protein